MAGIPPTIETDSEDVAWALQTADALWKRDERLDAIVWLRRAAQAAGDAEDDDRALALARNAAELADWMGRAVSPGPPPSPPPGSLPGAPVKRDSGAGRRAGEVHRHDDEATSPDMTLPIPLSEEALGAARPRMAPPIVQLPSIVPTLKPARLPSSSPLVALPAPRVAVEEAPKADVEAGHVPTAAEVHAGMLDPWAEAESPPRARELAEPPTSRLESRPTKARDGDEVVTSAPPVSQPAPRGAAPMSPPPSLAQPARAAFVPPSVRTGPVALHYSVRTGPAEPQPVSEAQPMPSKVGRTDELGIPHDWPDSTRRILNRGAAMREIVHEEEVSGFALVSVLSGEVDVAATIVDAPAERLRAGTMLRARGTIEATVPLRVIAAAGGGRVATWNEKQVAQAFAPCPEVEDALRVAANRIQALVGATMGPLGERLDTPLRAEVTSRLRLHVVGEQEIFAKVGQPVPGLLVVGAGELEFLGRDGAPEGPVLRSGDFLFPSEVLRAALAPRSVRGAKGGALVLMADRAVAQELLVTFPLLLEILAEA